LSCEVIKAKALGLAFSIQNACDYFDAASKQKLNQRVVSLYYGAIALASAEMLASPNGPTSLQEVEDMTKFGHGLYTFHSVSDNPFEGFVVGVISNYLRFILCSFPFRSRHVFYMHKSDIPTLASNNSWF